MTQATLDFAKAQLETWQGAAAELAVMEVKLSRAMTQYSQTLGDPPRQLIIDLERKRAEVGRLFDLALAALDACSPVPTGATGFGNLP